MKRIVKYVFAGLLSVLFCASCFSYDLRDMEPSYREYPVVTLQNTSSRDIVWFVPDAEYADSLPDSLTESMVNNMFIQSPGYAFAVCYFIPNKSGLDPWVEPFPQLINYAPGDDVDFYVFDAEVVDTTDWKTIKDNSLWLARYSCSAKAIADMNYRLNYPSGSNMLTDNK